MFGTVEPYAGIKKAQSAGKGAADTSAGQGTSYGSRATDIGSTLVPALTTEATHPTGFNPTDLQNMLTEAGEAAGGTNAAIAGEASNAAARTHNTGALSGVLDEAARQRTKATTSAALDIANKNAMLKEKQRQAGLTGLEGLYGTDVNAQLKEQSLVPEDINAWSNAGKTGWLQNTMGVLDTLKASKGPGAFI